MTSTSASTTTTIASAWYKQGWPWFLIVLPAVAVVASFVSLAIALQHGDSALQDTYSKQGFAIQRETQLDKMAAQHQLQADLTLTASGTVTLNLEGALREAPAHLTLNFIHPFDAHGDLAWRCSA